MNTEQIRELAQIVSENGLTELTVEEGNLRVHIAKAAVAAAPAAVQPPAPAPAAPMPPPAQEAGVDFNKTIEVKSSLIGVFYAASAPDAEPFVRVGSKVNKGDVLCIVEAMKLMNEIVAEQSGEIVDVCVGSGDVVEFGQTLFKLC